MNLFPYGIISDSEDFRGFTLRQTLTDVEIWLDASPFQSQIYNCPKGSGKTTLMRYYLSEDKRKQLATEKKLLIKDCPLSTSFLCDAEGIFCCIIDAIVGSISIMEAEDRELFNSAFASEMQKDSFEDFRKDKDKAFELIKSLTAMLKSRGYFIVLLIEDFHLLSCSSSCDVNTFNNMAYFDQLGLLGYIVLSDYHVSVGSEAYHMSEFERIFKETQPIPKIKKLKQKKLLYSVIHNAISKQQEIDELESEELFEISEQEAELLMNLTDGIPGMIQNAVNAYYDARLTKNSAELTSDEFMNVVFEGCKPLMREWIRYLNDTAHWDTLRVIYDNREVNATTFLERDKDKSSALMSTGLIMLDSLTRKYSFTCPLFERFIAEELNRPFHIPSQTEELVKALERRNEKVVIENINITTTTTNTTNNSSTNINNSTNNTLKVENTVIAPGLTASGILQLLNTDSTAGLFGDTRAGYASALAKQFCEIQSKPLPAALNPMNEDAIDFQTEQDIVFDEFGSQIVQNINIDDDHDLIDVSPAELETLDKRFSEARSRNVRSELTDSFLRSLSERCQFYLKLSVVVEDALGFIKMEDYSPQLVLYGKALEQTLRDNFFELFHSDNTLSAYKVDNNSVFANVEKDKSFIASYQFIIRDNSDYLYSLAEKNQVRFQGKKLTSNWWRLLKDEIHKARLIRNMADHAGNQSPTIENVNDIFNHLVGSEQSEGILRKSKVGIYIMNMLMTGDSSLSELLTKDACTATITEIKPDFKIQAMIEDCPVAVKISQKRVRKFLLANPGVSFEVGMKISVKLTEYGNNETGDFIIATIISA